MKNLEQITLAIQQVQPRLKELGVGALHVFGSVARGEAHAGSDVDLLVDFIQPPTFDQYMNLKFFLEDHLGSPVDLLTRPSVRPEIRSFIEEDTRRVA